MQMPEAWESRCASKTPYGMATITMEMALLLCSKAGSVLRLVDQYAADQPVLCGTWALADGVHCGHFSFVGCAAVSSGFCTANRRSRWLPARG